LQNYDINKLKNIISSEKIKGANLKTNARDSDDCLLEVTVLLKEFFDFIYNERSETIANGLIALDSWISNRQNGTYAIRDLKIGQVYMADLGLGYNNEAGYYHPIVILDVIGATVMVLPVTSSTSQVNSASTNRYLKLIERADFENSVHTLDSTSVAIMSNLRVIGPNRLLLYIGTVNATKIGEIKEETVSITFGKIIADYKKEVSTLKNNILELENKVSEIEKQLENQPCNVNI
jgi:mRNA-degrading endonuclease toxin of MazEF toxin-antitoxin module